MKINFKIHVLELDGTPAIDTNGSIVYLNKILADFLYKNPHTDTGFSPTQAVLWALDIYQGKVIDLEKEEQELMKAFIDKTSFWAAAKEALKAHINNPKAYVSLEPEMEQKSNGKDKKQAEPSK